MKLKIDRIEREIIDITAAEYLSIEKNQCSYDDNNDHVLHEALCLSHNLYAVKINN
jgi:hypothetical protein